MTQSEINYEKFKKAFQGLQESYDIKAPKQDRSGLKVSETLVVEGVRKAFCESGYELFEIAFADTQNNTRGKDIIIRRISQDGKEYWWIIEAKGNTRKRDNQEENTQQEDKAKDSSAPTPLTNFQQALGQLLMSMIHFKSEEHATIPNISYGIAVPYTYYYTQRCDQVAKNVPHLGWHWFYVSSEGHLALAKEPEGCTCLEAFKNIAKVLTSEQSASENAPGKPPQKKSSKPKASQPSKTELSKTGAKRDGKSHRIPT